MSKVYICTAIPYVNGNPHIGHAMDYLLADSYARFRRLMGDDVRLQVGTDEHGNKVFSAAAKNNLSVEDYASQNSQKFRDFINGLNISYTDFIRTTNPDHTRRCQAIWEKLRPHIYSADYNGWYCEGCERFVTEKEYNDNHGTCPDHQKPYQRLTETNYYLRIADFKDEIRRQIETGKMKILPEFRKQEMLKLLDDAPDVSISRPRKQLSWGVSVPGDDTQVMYVWMDALSNYITVLGYPDQPISDYWPATVQFVGKDILRFHTIIWPAILLGLGLDLPETVTSHGFVLADGQKMSKSIGNVVDPMEVLERHGLPAFRYYFLRHVDSFADSDFTWEKFDEAYNHELANDLGNLVQRLATLCHKNNISGIKLDDVLSPECAGETADSLDNDTESRVSGGQLSPEFISLMGNFEMSKAFDLAWSKIQDLNKAIDASKPWELAKTGDTEKLESVLKGLAQDLLQASVELSVFLPDTALQIQTIFGADGTVPVPESPLFPKG